MIPIYTSQLLLITVHTLVVFAGFVKVILAVAQQVPCIATPPTIHVQMASVTLGVVLCKSVGTIIMHSWVQQLNWI